MAVKSKNEVMNIDVHELQQAAVAMRGAYMAKILGAGFALMGRLATRLTFGVIGEVRQWRQRDHMRAELMALEPRILRDIGIHRADIPEVANRTVAKHFEQVPYDKAA